MSQTVFQVGQIIYILSETTQTVVPGMVVEETVVKKLDGVSTSYKISIGPPSKPEECKIYNSDKIKGELFQSLQEVESTMRKRFEEYLQTVIKKAEKKVKAVYTADNAAGPVVPVTTLPVQAPDSQNNQLKMQIRKMVGMEDDIVEVVE